MAILSCAVMMIIMSVLDKIVAFIAPHNCLSCSYEGSLLCADCMSELGSLTPDRCFRCNRQSPSSKTCPACRRVSTLNHVWIRSEYKGVPKELVQKLKFERAIAVADVIAEAMTKVLPTDIVECVLVPIPTATTRKRQRGYDQSVMIARRISRLANLPMQQHLVRTGQTRQVGSKKVDRISQLAGAYRVVHGEKLSGKQVILVDDVLTTGATLESAARILREAGVKQVNALVFARA
ncbi:MAG: competence protein ComFC [Patescibacteria group bacterium]|nr:competence protein ComFC [Patescibacteria group bacterium]